MKNFGPAIGMTYKIKWTDRANADVDEIKKFLKKHWGDKIVRDFLADLYMRTSMISDQPKMFQETAKRSGVRRSVLNKHKLIYYRIEKDFIEILSVSDARQDPKNIRF